MVPRRPPPVSMQIMLTPSDYADVRHLLPHQLRVWGGQVDEILCLVDVPPTADSAAGDLRALGPLQELFEEQRRVCPHLAWRLVDYSPAAVRQVETTFYGGRPVPRYDFRGRPIYAYLHLLLATRHDLVFHIDCDMLFGGGSQTWMAEAVDQLSRRPELLACNPLPGPPRPDGQLLSQRYRPVPEPGVPYAYLLPTLSYRVFLLDRRAFAERLGPLHTEWPPLPSVVSSLVLRHRWPRALLEQVIARAMMRRGLRRLDFLGVAPGMWSLHPKVRGTRYTEALPELLRMVEAGDVPDVQRGEYDLTEEMFQRAEAFRLMATHAEARW